MSINRAVLMFVTAFALATEGRAGGSIGAPFLGLDIEKVAPEHRAMLLKAAEDCVEVEGDRKPKIARPYPVEELDGGSLWYSGDGYSLLVRHSLFLVPTVDRKIIGYSYGYELYLCPMADLESHPGMKPVVSKVWFRPERPPSRRTVGQAIRPNKSPEPTATAVTPPAAQEPRRP